jgi:MinD superfamily P-loop ATPase
MEVWLRLEGERVTQSTFITDGCATSMACGSAAAYLTQDKSPGEIQQLRPIDVLETLGDPNNTEAHHCTDLALTTFAKALVVDCPPGTGDEHLAVHQALGQVEGAVIVTTPQEVATLDARKAITFCRSSGIPVLGILENMSGFTCLSCGTLTPVFQTGGGRHLAEELGLPFLGALPLDPSVAEGGDGGHPRLYVQGQTGAAKAFEPILQALLNKVEVPA